MQKTPLDRALLARQELIFQPAASDFAALMANHRSIRQYRDEPLPADLIDDVLTQAMRGSSSSGMALKVPTWKLT